MVAHYIRGGLCDGIPLVSFAHEAFISEALNGQGEWESLQTEYLQQLVGPGDVVLDVGAHIGSHSVALARAVSPGGAVHALEPQSGV